MHKYKHLIMGIMGASALLVAQDANAQVTLLSMFANAQSSFEAIIRLIKFVAFIIGTFLVVGAIFKFSQMGSDPKITVKVPLSMFICGVAIFALVGSVGVLTTTLALGSGGGPGSIFLPGTVTGGEVTKKAMESILIFIRLLGYVAFVRGWLMVNDYAQGKQASLAKGITHLCGGIFAINVTEFAGVLANTFAPGVPTPFG